MCARAGLPFGRSPVYQVLVGLSLPADKLGRRRTNRRDPLATPIDTDLLCPTCGYYLRGLVEYRCPECGEPFDPVTLRREAQRAELEKRIYASASWPEHLLSWARRYSNSLPFLWLPLLVLIALALGPCLTMKGGGFKEFNCPSSVPEAL
jgi:DNA-directed RNA polymerase subunit RPC12/RpoP